MRRYLILLLTRKPDSQLEMLDRRGRVTGPPKSRADECRQRRQLVPLLGVLGRKSLLELGGSGKGTLALEHQPRQENRSAEMCRIDPEQVPQGLARRLTLIQMKLNYRLSQKQRYIIRSFGQALRERIESQLVLPVIQQPLRSLNIGFDTLAAPLIFLPAATVARGIGVDQRHRGPFSERKNRFEIVMPLIKH